MQGGHSSTSAVPLVLSMLARAEGQWWTEYTAVMNHWSLIMDIHVLLEYEAVTADVYPLQNNLQELGIMFVSFQENACKSTCV